MESNNKKIFGLPPESMARVMKRSAIAMVFFFIPILQLYSAVIAFPLFMHPAIGARGAYMAYSFAYFSPTSLVTVGVFVSYYLTVFYVIELIVSKVSLYAVSKRVGSFIGSLLK
jgi:hypothetical protein